MVRFRLLLSPTAEKDYANLEAGLKQRIVEKLKWFLENDVSPESLEGNKEILRVFTSYGLVITVSCTTLIMVLSCECG
jgi:hypothetical protein